MDASLHGRPILSLPSARYLKLYCGSCIYGRVFEIYKADTQISVAVLRGDSKVSGTVTFEQASENAETTVSWNITGHDANAERGMHVHAFGDNTNGCTSAGPHCMFSIACHLSGRVLTSL